ncbi:probable thiopurine S-methyltransferase [Mercenaria mercenaria]|uniref:probable thiopurine S-methyltransferase n=1 Tax=Mercenaria mercenaria TaxID=6596 RepID=UPI00234E3B54|nr:probable thiopurine S-methyltransferase [Mercenaria mercenaria]
MSGKVVETDLDAGVCNNKEWVKRWAEGDTPFHQSTHDRFLDEREEEMFQGRKKSIFMPLCGKTFDILWMYRNGHTVCGVEIAEQPVKEFFEENEIDHEIQAVENIGNLYKSKDGRLKLYVADLFDMSREICGQYDVVWDRRSFQAINLVDHQQYRDLLVSLMKEDTLYYLGTVEYDPTVWPGPPHSLSDEVVRDVFGEYCIIELLEEKERETQDTNASQIETESDGGKPESDGGKTTSKPKSFGEACKMSSYVYDRWYKMTLKLS